MMERSSENRDERSAYRGLRVVGHRGAAALAPENTMASFERAARAGVAAVEADAHLSRDGHVVLIHDDRLDRTTPHVGLVGSRTAEQLIGLGVPTLRTLLLGAEPGLDIYVDMKQPGRALPGAVVGTARSTGTSERLWLTGTDLGQLRHARRLDGEVRLSWTLKSCESTLTVASVVEAAVLGVEELAIHARELSGDLLELAHDFGIAVRAFGMDSARNAARVLALGCTTLTLDDPRVPTLAAAAG